MADGLIYISTALELVLDAVRPLGSEDLSLAEALGRVLAADVAAAEDLPPFDSSAMDGYAVIAGPGGELEVVDESRAGHPAERAHEPSLRELAARLHEPSDRDVHCAVRRCESGCGLSEWRLGQHGPRL